MNRKKLITIGLLLATILGVALIFAYNSTKQQNSAEYNSLTTQLSKATESKDAISRGLSEPTASLINEDFVIIYTKYSDDFSRAIEAVKNSAATKSNPEIKATYEKYSQTIDAYKNSNKELIATITQYLKIGEACRAMGLTFDNIHAANNRITESSYATGSKGCKEAVAALDKTVVDDQFMNQYLANYLTSMNDLIETYRIDFASVRNQPTIKASAAAVNESWNAVLSLNDTLINITISPDPSSALNELQEVVANQR